jgi:glycosyltransferase involved in cell wall biosynthesis
MPTGSGAIVVHHYLSEKIPDYTVAPYHPIWEFFPFALPLAVPFSKVRLIHTTPDFAIYFSRPSTPLVLTIHNFVLDQFMQTYSSTLQRIHYRTYLRVNTRLALQRASHLIAVSRFTAEQLSNELLIQKPIEIIYNGVDLSRFSPHSGRSRSGEIRVFFSGNLSTRKGAQWLFQIAKQLKPGICIYYTRGLRSRMRLPDFPNLKALGPIPLSDMPGLYRSMDLLVLPTVREGLSMAVLEAMACGLPVVASDCSSLPEQIDNGHGGFLCQVGDVNSFAERISILADSTALRRTMGEHNRDKCERMFAVDRMVSDYRRVFDSILEK